MDFISTKWLLILLCAAAWTTFFSLFNTPRIRGWRNLGWMACFLIGLVMLIVLPWRVALATWSVVGVASGLLYYCYGCYSRLTAKSEECISWPRPSTSLHGLLIWPIMLPEAIEYWLADIGVLRHGAKAEKDA
jgi:hypothetical protein